MPVKSYLAISLEGKLEKLVQAVLELDSCEIFPAENKEVLVIVTDTKDEEEEQKLQESLNNLPGLKHLSMVSGFKSHQV